MSELISIIMPSYRSARFIEQAMRSALAQTYQEIELLVIDNPSDDNTSAIISNIAANDQRVRHLRLLENLGSAARTRNYGIQRAKGKYLAFLDSDDVWMPEKLQKQVETLLKNNGAFSYTGYRVIDEEGAIICPH